MRQTGVLTAVLPESEKWGIDAIHGLVAAERDLGWKEDAVLRLESLLPPDAARMEALAKRLRLSNAEAARLASWANTQAVHHATGDAAFAKIAFRGDRQGLEDRLKLALAAARARAAQEDATLLEAGGFSRLLRFLQGWERPVFPLKGSDLVALGAKQDKQLGERLKALETGWIESGFRESRDALLAEAARMIETHPPSRKPE